MSIDIQQSTTQSALLFFLTASSDHISGLTGATAAVKISKNGATGVSPSGAVSQVDATNMPGWYKVAGNATDTNTLGPLALHATATGADPCDLVVANIVAYNPQDSARLGLTSLSASPPLPRYTGTAQTGGSNTITLANGTSSLQGGIGDLIILTGGTGAGQSGIVLSTTGTGGTTPVATMVQSWQSGTPDGTTTYEILKIGQLVPAQPADVWNSANAPTRVVTAATNITSDGTSAARESTLGTPAHATVSGDIASVATTLGAPAGGSVAVALAAVKAVLPTALSTAGNMKADVLEVNNSGNLAGTGVAGDNWRPTGAPPG